MTQREWLQIAVVLAAAYGPDWGKERIVLMGEMLNDLPADAVFRGALRHIQRSKWPPTVAELREAAAEDDADPTLDAERAWGQVIREIRRVGWPGTPHWDDPLLPTVMRDLGWEGQGWVDLCASDVNAMAAHRAHFVRWYTSAAQRHRRAADAPALERVWQRLLPELRKIGQLPEEGGGA